MLALVDPYILAFSAITVVVTVFMGFWAARKSKSAADFFVAGRGVSVGWNASAISGEYLSAASFMGVAGMVMSSGYDALWYPVCYACGYLFLLLFIAGPLRRFGAYTIPDFAEGRYDSPVFRKIAVIFVLFIGFFYTMPQMKGAGTTLAYIFKDIDFMGHKGLPYWVGVVLVGAVITLNVALGGMKGITLVQAFQYWAKMFAISVPVFVLMSVYGSYGKQLGVNGSGSHEATRASEAMVAIHVGPVPGRNGRLPDENLYVYDGGMSRGNLPGWKNLWTDLRGKERRMSVSMPAGSYTVADILLNYTQSHVWQWGVKSVSGYTAPGLLNHRIAYSQSGPLTRDEFDQHIAQVLADNGLMLFHITPEYYKLVPTANAANYGIEFRPAQAEKGQPATMGVKPEEGYGPETIRQSVTVRQSMTDIPLPSGVGGAMMELQNVPAAQVLGLYESYVKRTLLPGQAEVSGKLDRILDGQLNRQDLLDPHKFNGVLITVHGERDSAALLKQAMEKGLAGNGITLVPVGEDHFRAIETKKLDAYFAALAVEEIASNSTAPKVPAPSMTLAPGASVGFAMITTPGDLAKIAAGTKGADTNGLSLMTNVSYHSVIVRIGDRHVNLPDAAGQIVWNRNIANGLANTPSSPGSVSRQPLTAKAPKDETWLNPFGPLTTKAAKAALPKIEFHGEMETNKAVPLGQDLKSTLGFLAFKLERAETPGSWPEGQISAIDLANIYARNILVSEPGNFNNNYVLTYAPALMQQNIKQPTISFSNITERLTKLRSLLTTNGITVLREPGNVFKAFLTKDAIITPINAKPYALLYTYSLIIALVCGTAGLPHILVRFYTNPDGAAAKRTTMWVMILIGIFYVFPPVFGALGRNLMPSLYEGAGVGGTDGLVLKLPTILNERFGVLGSVLSGITCAGAFAAFMSTFSGLLVSMTGALAHDVYGRILRPKSTAAERMQMFKWCAVAIGLVAVLLGTLVENFEINFMVGQAFAIAAASYFPLLFMSVWWRGMTTRGAATGMLTGGLCAVAAISVASWTTFFTAQAAKFKSLGVPEPGWFATLKPYALTDFWAAHPLLRILSEQPAIWAVPLAITLMVIVSKLTAREVPADIRMKMLVLHAPEALGLKQEYIREHDGAH